MTVRHDPVLARALARELGARWTGRRATGCHLAPEPRAAELRFEDAPSLLFLLHPEEGAVLETPPTLPGEGARFRRLWLGSPWAPADERLLFLPLVDGRERERHRLAVELHTNQWNALLLDAVPSGDGGSELRIRRLLRPRRTAHRRLEPGAAYLPPPGGRAWTGEPPTADAWLELLGSVPPGERRSLTLREVAWTSAVNVEHLLGEAIEEEGEAPLRAALGRYLELRRAAGIDPGGRSAGAAAWLLPGLRGGQPYPDPLGEPEARPFPSLLAAMAEAVGGAEARERRLRELGRTAPLREAPPAGGRRGREEALRLRRALLDRRKRLRRRIAALGRELDAGPDPEDLRALGHLLLARLDRVPRGAERAALEGFDGTEREVELDPRLGPAENAEAYFDEAARRERARERIPTEVAAARRSLGKVERGLERLETALRPGGKGEPSDPEAARLEPDAPSLDPDALEELWELAGGRPAAGAKPGEEGAHLPYLRYRSSGGLEIRVGRSARANDDLTFRHSSPEDVWLHARQVRGAHVILRWGRREENPPKRDLLEAAVAAAVHSGARHSGTVAVDWTRRKYVRKPRKAPPGAVVPEQVQTVFVEPDAELLEKLKAEG